jgi:hypothetical protein
LIAWRYSDIDISAASLDQSSTRLFSAVIGERSRYECGRQPEAWLLEESETLTFEH